MPTVPVTLRALSAAASVPPRPTRVQPLHVRHRRRIGADDSAPVFPQAEPTQQPASSGVWSLLTLQRSLRPTSLQAGESHRPTLAPWRSGRAQCFRAWFLISAYTKFPTLSRSPLTLTIGLPLSDLVVTSRREAGFCSGPVGHQTSARCFALNGAEVHRDLQPSPSCRALPSTFLDC